jgi:lysophospholipase L1-like esterase
MTRRQLTIAIVGAWLSIASTSSAQPVRIMALGDSITGSPGCWRALLWSRLQNAGFQNIDMVGTLPAPGCGITYDGDNEGHGGFLATNVANQNQLVGWLAATDPDIVMMHFGTNDVWSSIAPATILAAFSRLVDQMRASNPNMKILVAQIIPLNPSNCAACAQRVVDFNAQIPAWASGKSTAQSPIIVVDQWTGFNAATDTTDGAHPNAAGNQKISDRWFPALSALLTPGAPPPPPPPPPGGDGSCEATYRIANQWQGNFQGEVSVRNTSGAPLPRWTVTFAFANGQTISQAWSAIVTQTQANVTARNHVEWGALPASQTTTFGFIASWNGTNAAPAATCVGQ